MIPFYLVMLNSRLCSRDIVKFTDLSIRTAKIEHPYTRPEFNGFADKLHTSFFEEFNTLVEIINFKAYVNNTVIPLPQALRLVFSNRVIVFKQFEHPVSQLQVSNTTLGSRCSDYPGLAVIGYVKFQDYFHTHDVSVERKRPLHIADAKTHMT